MKAELGNDHTTLEAEEKNSTFSQIYCKHSSTATATTTVLLIVPELFIFDS